MTIKTAKWGTKNTVVYNTSQRPEIIGRETRTLRLICCWSFLWGSSIYWWRSSLAMTSLCNATLRPQWHFPGYRTTTNFSELPTYDLRSLGFILYQHLFGSPLVILIINKIIAYYFYIPLLPFLCNVYAFTLIFLRHL